MNLLLSVFPARPHGEICKGALVVATSIMTGMACEPRLSGYGEVASDLTLSPISGFFLEMDYKLSTKRSNVSRG